MRNGAAEKERIFKTAWFAKTARKANLDDAELCKAVQQVMLGQADDLGGGVYKKRLGKNLYRSIVLAKGGRYWVYAYLFAKQDKANISVADLADLRNLASAYAKKTDYEISRDIAFKELVEICR